MSDIENKYITTADYNKFIKDILASKIKTERLVDKSDITGFINNADWDRKVVTLVAKAELKELKVEQDKMIKLQAFDSSYSEDKSHFEDDDTVDHRIDILKGLVILIIFHNGNLNDCLMKVLKLLLHLIKFLNS